MKTPLRFVWILTLLFFTAGCSGYRFVGSSLEEVAQPPHRDQDSSSVVRINDRVRLTLLDGTRVEGRVQLISPDEIVLDPAGQSVQPRGYSTYRVRSIEIKTGSGSSTDAVLAISLAAVAIGCVVAYQATADLRNGILSN